MPQLHDLTATEAADKIILRTLSPTTLMEALLLRAETLEPSLKAWVTLNGEQALKAARDSEVELDKNGPRGRLHGVPVGIKDIFYTKDMKTTGGSVIFKDYTPEYDATVVSKLRKSGAIIMGKMVTTEFAVGDPPPTRNPWNISHTPGGSSSGSAVGVAARVVPIALGSQTAGSVLRPASYNGVVGMKPTFGRISRMGVMPVAWSLDTVGTFSRSVADTALILEILAGQDKRDSSTSDRPVPDYRLALVKQHLAPRIGVVRQFFFDKASSEVYNHTNNVIVRMEEAGASISTLDIPTNFETLLSAHRIIMAVEAATVHQSKFCKRAVDYSPDIRGLIEEGMVVPSVAYMQSQRIRRRFQREVIAALEHFDVLLTPSTGTHAPKGLTTTGDRTFQVPWTAAGIPAISIPSGLSKAGLPLGIQLAAGPFEESRLFSVASWFEDMLDMDFRPALDHIAP